MTDTAGTAIAVLAALGAAGLVFGLTAAVTLLSRYPGTTGARNAANPAGAAAGPQVPAVASGRNAGPTWEAR